MANFTDFQVCRLYRARGAAGLLPPPPRITPPEAPYFLAVHPGAFSSHRWEKKARLFLYSPASSSL